MAVPVLDRSPRWRSREPIEGDAAAQPIEGRSPVIFRAAAYHCALLQAAALDAARPPPPC